MIVPQDPLTPDGSPAQAFAKHNARINSLVWCFTQTHPLDTVNGKAEKNYAITLRAQLHGASDEQNFKVGNKFSFEHIPTSPWPCTRDDSAIVL
jgi:hypothetical protein